MKSLFRTVSVLLLAGTALISACQNPLDAEKVSIINSDAKAQAEALSAAADLLGGNSEYLSSLNSIILSLEGLDNDNLANIVDNLASMKGADPLFIKEMLSLAARYKLAPDEATKVSVGNSILAAAAGELARAKARKEACEDAAAAKSEMENTVNTLKGKLSALPADAKSFDEYKNLTAQTNSVLADVADFVKPWYANPQDQIDAFTNIASKLGDSFLGTAVLEYGKCAATRQSLIDLQNSTQGKMAKLSELGEESSKALQGLESRLDGKLGELDTTLGTLSGNVTNILASMEFAGEEGLQAYIDAAAQKAYEDAVSYVDDYLDILIDQLNDLFEDIYTQLETQSERIVKALSSIQSIVYVPDYDDLKMTVNYGTVTQPVYNEADGSQLKYTAIVDLPSTVTYQILPAQYAKEVATQLKAGLGDIRQLLEVVYGYDTSGKSDKDLAKEFGVDAIVGEMNVISLQTRAGAAPDINCRMDIIDVVSYDNATGYITLKVQPRNIVSASFIAGGLKPRYDIGLSDGNGYYIRGWDPYDWSSATGIFRAEDPVDVSKTFTIPVWSLEDLQAYQARTAFGVQLKLYHFLDFDSKEDYDWDNCDWDLYYSDPDYYPPVITVYTDYENELASTFTTLYPNAVGGGYDIEAVAAPYKLRLDAEGNPVINDAYGICMLDYTEEESVLPYNVFYNAENESEPGYRTYLDGLVPVVLYQGVYMSAEDAKRVFNVDLGLRLSEEAEFDFDGVDENVFIVDPETYATIEMNPEASEEARAAAKGHKIVARYRIDGPLGSYYMSGAVNITN